MDIPLKNASEQHATQNGVPGNVADAIVAQLAAAGVKRVYGVIGDGVFPLAGALQRQTDVQFVAATDETNAAYMASYDAKVTGDPGVCMATSGPGATNLATGLAHAYFDGAPVLAITGQGWLPPRRGTCSGMRPRRFAGCKSPGDRYSSSARTNRKSYDKV